MRYIICIFAIPGAALLELGNEPVHYATGAALLLGGAVCATALQSPRFTEWLGQFF